MDFDIVLCCDSKYGLGNFVFPKAFEQNDICLVCSNEIGVINTDNRFDKSEEVQTTIPWKISEDMKFFRDLTKNVPHDSINPMKTNAVIMGRKTADTLKDALIDRLNIVITNQKEYRPGFTVFKTLDDALNSLSKNTNINKVFVIGGSTLADTAIYHPRCRNVYLNKIARDYNCSIKLSNKFISKLSASFVDTSNKDNNKQIVICKNINSSVVLEFNKYSFVNHEEIQYLDMLNRIIKDGDYRMTRNAKTFSVFGERLIFDLANGFPLLTTKKMFYRGIFEELLFFIRGDTNTKHLEEKKVMIWHPNTTEEFMKKNNKNLEKGDMGPMYGFLWRHYGESYDGCDKNYEGKGTDQLQQAIDLIVKDPNSRRILMTTYDPSIAEQGVLFPCHGLSIQFYVEKDNKLSLQMYQR